MALNAKITERLARLGRILRRGQGELLSTFALLAIVVLLASLGVSSLVVAEIMADQAKRNSLQTAPVVMNLMTRAAQNLEAGAPEGLRKLAGDCARLSNVAYCKIHPPRNAPGTNGANGTIESTGHEGELLLTLTGELTGREGAPLGVLEVGFADPRGEDGVLWTALGTIAVACLAVFVLIYRLARRQMQPLDHVRENLLAFHSGAERALEMLNVQSLTGTVSEAWNMLIQSIRNMQDELESARCVKTLAESSGRGGLLGQSSQGVLEALPLGILKIDSEDQVAYANRAATSLLQLADAGKSGAALAARLEGPNRGVAAQILGLRQACSGMGVDAAVESGGTRSIVRLTAVSNANDSDDLIVLVQDVTQVKEAEQARDEFLTHITHELRTPLTNIRAYTETLSDDFFDDEKTRRECYNVIVSETRRLSKLVEGVLSVSQVEAGAARLARTAVRLDQSLRQVAQEIQAAADAKNIELVLKIPSKVPVLQADKHRLHQVWMNLLGNAVKYTPKGGSVRVDVEPSERAVQVRVSDTGIGIAPEVHEKIFEKFFRVKDAAVEAEEGTGLGLAITREIVRIHGGTIHVESAAGAGSTFIVELPTAREDENSSGMEAAGGTNRHR